MIDEVGARGLISTSKSKPHHECSPGRTKSELMQLKLNQALKNLPGLAQKPSIR